MREITFAKAINEAIHQLLDTDNRTILIGQGVTSPWYVGSTTVGLLDKYGKDRIIETPVSENATTGVAIGAAMTGLRPILEHPRMDFMYLAMDQIANHAASTHFMFGGNQSVPLTIWGIINRGGEQAAQHSQALQATFAHMPGLKVVMPSTPYDAKGLLIASVEDDNPVLYIDDRWLYKSIGEVPEEKYTTPIGKAAVRRAGKDLTVVATSHMNALALDAAEILAKDGIDIEVVDLRTIKPIDEETIFESVTKTGRLVVADGGCRTYGVTAEIAALVAEHVFNDLKAPIARISLPDSPAPASIELERSYYPSTEVFVNTIKRVLAS